jgi:hypothetical protein
LWFELSGPRAQSLAAQRVPYRIETHAVALEGGASRLVASEQEQFRPGVFRYSMRQDFPMPGLGRHELHRLVLVLPPGDMLAAHRGPVINVVP